MSGIFSLYFAERKLKYPTVQFKTEHVEALVVKDVTNFNALNSDYLKFSTYFSGCPFMIALVYVR